MTVDVCRLCLKRKELCRSHVIPNALIRRIKRGAAGRMVEIDDSEANLVRYSSETWSEYLLCQDCEQDIAAIEHYALETLRGQSSGVAHFDGHGVVLSVDYARLKLFFTSLLWRAAVSSSHHFAKIRLPGGLREEARASLLSSVPLPPRKLGVRLDRLFDPTPATQGGFRKENFDNITISPVARPGAAHSSYLFVIEGYLVETFVPAAPFKHWTRPGVLKDAKTLYVPRKSLFDVPELMAVLVAGRRKIDTGKSTVK